MKNTFIIEIIYNFFPFKQKCFKFVKIFLKCSFKITLVDYYYYYYYHYYYYCCCCCCCCQKEMCTQNEYNNQYLINNPSFFFFVCVLGKWLVLFCFVLFCFVFLGFFFFVFCFLEGTLLCKCHFRSTDH